MKMEEGFEKLFAVLLGLEKKGISDTDYSNRKFSFKYGGGKFILIKSVSPNLTTGYLTLFHETPFEGKDRLIEVKDFEIKITRDHLAFDYRIKNHMAFRPEDHRRFVGEDGYIRIELDDLPEILPNQLSEKLIKDDFRIYII